MLSRHIRRSYNDGRACANLTKRWPDVDDVTRYNVMVGCKQINFADAGIATTADGGHSWLAALPSAHVAEFIRMAGS